jgi:hypothetical protein
MGINSPDNFFDKKPIPETKNIVCINIISQSACPHVKIHFNPIFLLYVNIFKTAVFNGLNSCKLDKV